MLDMQMQRDLYSLVLVLPIRRIRVAREKSLISC